MLSGSGQVERDYTEEEMQTWSDVLQKWTDLNSRPAKLQRLIRKVLFCYCKFILLQRLVEVL